jgi:hypothetical protein
MTSWVDQRADHVEKFEGMCLKQGLSIAKGKNGHCDYKDAQVAHLWSFYTAGVELENQFWQSDYC